MHIGEGFQDVIVAVNFWSHLTRELLVKCLANELDMSDPTTVSKADNNDTATEREMEKSERDQEGGFGHRNVAESVLEQNTQDWTPLQQ